MDEKALAKAWRSAGFTKSQVSEMTSKFLSLFRGGHLNAVKLLVKLLDEK